MSLAARFLLLPRYLLVDGHNREEFVFVVVGRLEGLLLVGLLGWVIEHADEQIVGDVEGVGLFEVVADDAAIGGLEGAVGIFGGRGVCIFEFG